MVDSLNTDKSTPSSTVNNEDVPGLEVRRHLLAVTATGPIYRQEVTIAVATFSSGLGLLQELALKIHNSQARVVSSLPRRLEGDEARTAWARLCGMNSGLLLRSSPRARIHFLREVLAYARRQGNVNGIEPIVGAAINATWPLITEKPLRSILAQVERWFSQSEFAKAQAIPIADPIRRTFSLFPAGDLARLDLQSWVDLRLEEDELLRRAALGARPDQAEPLDDMAGALGGLSGIGVPGYGGAGGWGRPGMPGLPGGRGRGSDDGPGLGGLGGLGVPGGTPGLDGWNDTGLGMPGGMGGGQDGPGGLGDMGGRGGIGVPGGRPGLDGWNDMGLGLPGGKGGSGEDDMGGLGAIGGFGGFGAPGGMPAGPLGIGANQVGMEWDAEGARGRSLQSGGAAAFGGGIGLVALGIGLAFTPAGPPLAVAAGVAFVGGLLTGGGAAAFYGGYKAEQASEQKKDAEKAEKDKAGPQGNTSPAPKKDTAPPPKKKEEPQPGDVVVDPDAEDPNKKKGGKGGAVGLWDDDTGGGDPTTIWDENGGGGRPDTIWDGDGTNPPSPTMIQLFPAEAAVGPGMRTAMVQVGRVDFALAR